MISEGKIKKAALLVALDISLKRMKKSPERCARNLMELGSAAYPDKLSKKEQQELLNELVSVSKGGDMNKVKDLFVEIFL